MLKESDDLVILRGTFDCKMIFQNHLRAVSRTAPQRLGILRKSWRVYHGSRLFRDGFGVFILPVLSTVLQCGARLPIHTINFCSQWCPFANWDCV